MVKIHTRAKRKIGITSSKPYNPRVKKKGAKTFSTQELAEEYAKVNGISKFTIAPAKKNKRFKIVE